MNTLQKIDRENRQRREERRILPYEAFRASFLDGVRNHPERFPEIFTGKNEKLISPVRYGKGINVCVLNEPAEWIRIFSKIADDTDSCSRLMKAIITGNSKDTATLSMQDTFSCDEITVRLPLKTAPEEGIWFNSTENGICIRPGSANGSVINLVPVILNDTIVHMLIAGRTGSGKSVALDSILMNLMHEYSPWELNLVQIDFKKVELSRYMNQAKAPHVRILAATDEKNYVLTVLKHLKNVMMARQTLFTYLGVKKISEFRQKYKVVLPRILVVCDEFQQLFQNTNSKQNSEIQSILNALIRMGRNTGIHLLFCSQDMSETVSGKLLAGFKARCALPCDAGISSEIIGNSAAASIETGSMIVNCGGGDIGMNVVYRIPLVSDGTEESDVCFQNYLNLFAECAVKYGYRPVQKYYQQEKQENISELMNMLRHPAVNQERDFLLKTYPQYRELITLGPSVVYRSEDYDIEQLALSADGLNQNVLAIADNAMDCAYLENLFCENLVTSSRFTRQENILFDYSLSVSSYYRLADHIQSEVYSNDEDLSRIRKIYAKRRSFLKACRQETVNGFVKVYTDSMSAILQDQRRYSELQAVLLGIFQNIETECIPDMYRKILEENPGRKALIEPLHEYWRFKVNQEPIDEIIPLLNIWISGIEIIEKLPGWFTDILKYSMNARMPFMIFSASSDIPLGDLVPRCDCIFLSTNNEHAYQRCHMNLGNSGDIVIDYRVQSRDYEGSFKKYRTDYETKEYPRISFDRIFKTGKGGL